MKNLDHSYPFTLSLIAAMAHHQVIGKQNQLPWRLPADLKHFKRITLGKPIIMGRKTFESIGSQPLPERENIILSRTTNPHTKNKCTYFNDLQTALQHLATRNTPPTEVMIIGGGTLYSSALPLADKMYLTFIDYTVEEGDAFFPAWDENEWAVKNRSKYLPDDKNKHAYEFVEMLRVEE